jgi:hypothetical protein
MQTARLAPYNYLQTVTVLLALIIIAVTVLLALAIIALGIAVRYKPLTKMAANTYVHVPS